MASHNYLYDGQQQQPAASSSTGYNYDSRYDQSNTPAPSYHTQSQYATPAHNTDPYHAPGQHHQQQTGPSPFDTIFDDNMYPTDSRQNLTPTPDPALHGAQHPFDASSAYQGYGRHSPNNGEYGPDDIPLQDRAGKGPGFVDVEDHIYDDPNANPDGERRKRRRRKPRKVEMGELGMFNASNKKRIPWFVYVMTAAQIGVFIGEIIKNGELTKSRSGTKTHDTNSSADSSADELTDHDPPTIQPDDRTFDLRNDQLWCALCPLHAQC